MTFEFQSLACRFRAVDRIWFPPGKTANMLRGAFGMALEPRWFAPVADGRGPSGLVDRPRAFVFRVRELDGAAIEPGAHFAVNVNLFDAAAVPPFTAAFREMAAAGIGPGRRRARLDSVAARPVSLSLDPLDEHVRKLRVEFLTPTELKPVSRPDFPILFARARDRVAALRTFYGHGAPEIDFAAMGRRSRAIRMTRCEIEAAGLERRSSRTGQTHSIGGFTGVAEYEGDLDEFLPFLRAAEWAGVGRHTVWGNGELRVVIK